MSNEKLLTEFRDDVFLLKYRDKEHLDKIVRKGKMLIRNIYGESTVYLSDFESISFYPGFAPAGEDYQRECWESGKSKIINLINTMLEEDSLFGAASSSNTEGKKQSTASLNRVFIVHGHDENAKINVARFIEKLGLEAIILHEQASKGKTIIEKFEEHASTSNFSIVLLTPDDVGYPQQKESEAKPRARQNVIFELGYFCGALSRKNVCVLYKEGVEIPNDYLGVVYTQFDDAGAWQLSLAKEMKYAGLDFDMNKAF
jgi:predicted nucleotide-binding protein